MSTIKVIVTLLLSVLTALATAAEPAIQGYSPVSYFTQGVAERGDPEFATEYEGRLYYMTSAEQLRAFREDPEKFVPALGAHCPYSLSLGRAVAIDPESFKIIDGRLYLFHRSDELDALKAWNEAGDSERARILEDAESTFILMRF